ncbi:MAG: hypothetical protein Q7K34_01245 [archaeon]|nr:hypothetical protein [archaeon]
MKGEEAAYIVNLKKAKMFTKDKRTRRALVEIKKFVHKHTRVKNVVIKNEVNEFIHAHSKNIPQKAEVVLRKKDDKILVYMKAGKELEADKKKETEEAKKAKEKKALEEKAKKEKEEKKSAEEKEKEEDGKKKLEDKKEKEKAGQALEVKRKSGRQ